MTREVGTPLGPQEDDWERGFAPRYEGEELGPGIVK